MLDIDSPGPVAGKRMFQRFGFANTLKRAAFSLLNEGVDKTKNFFVSFLPQPWHSADRKKQRLLMPADGADAARRAIGAAYYHPLAVRRFAPTIKRLKQTAGPAGKLAVPPPQIRRPVAPMFPQIKK